MGFLVVDTDNDDDAGAGGCGYISGRSAPSLPAWSASPDLECAAPVVNSRTTFTVRTHRPKPSLTLPKHDAHPALSPRLPAHVLDTPPRPRATTRRDQNKPADAPLLTFAYPHHYVLSIRAAAALRPAGPRLAGRQCLKKAHQAAGPARQD